MREENEGFRGKTVGELKERGVYAGYTDATYNCLRGCREQ